MVSLSGTIIPAGYRLYQLSLQRTAMTAHGDIGIILCGCRGRLAQRYDLGALKNDLAGVDGVAFVDMEDGLCHDPDPLKKRRSKGLVIAGCSNRKHIDFFKDTLERAKIPLFLCAFVDLLGLQGADPSSSHEATAFARLMIKAHIEKVRAAFEIAPRVKAAGVKEVMGVRKEEVTRRGFLRLPLMAAGIISHYEEIPLFDEKRCIAAKSPCRECVGLCPFDALVIRKDKIHVLEDRCRHCGLCATVCPVDAVQMPTFSDSQALRLVDALADCDLQVNRRSLVFTCDKGREKISENSSEFRRSPFNPITIRVPCVASLSPWLLLRSLELGFESVISLCPDGDCPKAKAMKAWRARMDDLLKVIESLGTASPLALLALDVEATPVFSRLLEFLPAKGGPCSLNPHPVEMSLHSREDLVRLLHSLVQNKALPNVPMQGLSLPFFDIRIDQEKCCLCGACARQCPAGALKIEEGNQPRIRYAAIRCVGCTQCVEICPEGAVTIHRIMDPLKLNQGGFVTKASDESARCRKCGKVIGKKRLLEAVERKLKNSGFENLAERVHYCQACKNRVALQG